MFQENTALSQRKVMLSKRLENRLTQNDIENIGGILSSDKKEIISNCNSENEMVRNDKYQIGIIDGKIIFYDVINLDEDWSRGGHMYVEKDCLLGNIKGICYQVKKTDLNRWKVLRIDLEDDNFEREIFY